MVRPAGFPNEITTGVHSSVSDRVAPYTADRRARYTHHGHLDGEGRRVVAPPCPRYTASVQRRSFAVRFSSSVNFSATIWPLIEILRFLVRTTYTAAGRAHTRPANARISLSVDRISEILNVGAYTCRPRSIAAVDLSALIDWLLITYVVLTVNRKKRGSTFVIITLENIHSIFIIFALL